MFRFIYIGRIILDDAKKKVLLFLLPFVLGQLELLQAHEFEHAAPRGCAGDHVSEGSPLLLGLCQKEFTMCSWD